MTLSNLYFRDCFENLSEISRDSIEEICKTPDLIDKSCSRADINTCGMSIERLFELYSLYNPQKGLYKTWGDIEFPWEISNLTPNLLFSETDDKWSVGIYSSAIAYKKDSLVLLIEEDGYRISLYRAKEDILSISGAFDYSKWEKVCHVNTTKPAGLPKIEELLSLYSFYKLKLFDTEWGKYQGKWEDSLKCLTLQDCIEKNLSYKDIVDCDVIKPSDKMQECITDGSSDQWDRARIRRDFFYRAGDIVLVEGECKDNLCVFIALEDMPASEYILNKYESEKFSTSIYLSKEAEENKQLTKIWQKIYCVPTGVNKCLGCQKTKDPEWGYDIVRIGSKDHCVEAPVPYRSPKKLPTLGELSEQDTNPRVLSDREIFDLDNPVYTYTEEC